MTRKFRGIAAVDLFCGVGGMTHGLIKAGIDVVAGIDSDATCRYAYERNNRSAFIKGDIREISGRAIRRMYPRGSVRILIGCAPCQPFSKHSQKIKNRQSDEKWGLLYRFGELIEETKPHVVSMENVPQIMKHDVYTDFRDLLERLGYRIFSRVVHCEEYGVPQARSRLVVLASKLGHIELIPATHKDGQTKTVRTAIGNGKLTPLGHGEVSMRDPLHRTYALSLLNQKRIRNSKPGRSWLDWDPSLRPDCYRKRSGETYTSVYGRMEWDKPAPTITTQFYSYGTGRFGHPEQDRALSLREGAILQTFPGYYDFLDPNLPISFKRLGTHIGNAVPVRLGYTIGKSIIEHVEGVVDVR